MKANVVDLDGNILTETLIHEDTPEAILAGLLEEIRNGKRDVLRLVIAVEIDGGYFNRSSCMTNAEAVTLTAISNRLAIDTVVEPST